MRYGVLFVRPIATSFITGLCALLATTICGSDNQEELQRVQGRFERTFANTAGTMFRVVKDVAGDQSVVTTYDDVGNIVESHTSTFKIEKRGPVRVLSFFNLVVTAGPAKGHTQLGTSSYIYRLSDDTFTEVWGLLEGDDSPPRMILWRRSKTE